MPDWAEKSKVHKNCVPAEYLGRSFFRWVSGDGDAVLLGKLVL